MGRFGKSCHRPNSRRQDIPIPLALVRPGPLVSERWRYIAPTDGIGSCHQPPMFLLHFRNICSFRGRTLSSSATSQVRQFKVVLDGQTLYVEKPLAEALGWNPGTGTEGISLRLSGWEPRFFAITPTGTDAGTYFVLVSRPASGGMR
jgi:hypothetical protein